MANNEPSSQTLLKNISFITISNTDLVLFEWKPPGTFKSFLLELNLIKENPASNIFFHINKGNMKLVHIKDNNNVIFSIGADNALQFQLLEALLESIAIKFHETYDIKVILSYGNVSTSIFKAFKAQIDEIIENFYSLDLIKTIRVQCMICNKTLHLNIKKTMIEKADSFPVPVVYIHEGHSIVCYIDAKFSVRGVELVNVTG